MPRICLPTANPPRWSTKQHFDYFEAEAIAVARPLSPRPYNSAVPKGPAFGFLNYRDDQQRPASRDEGENVPAEAKAEADNFGE